MAVYYVFPMFMISVRAAKGVILFKRGRQHDKEVRTPTLSGVVCMVSLVRRKYHRQASAPFAWEGVMCIARPAGSSSVCLVAVVVLPVLYPPTFCALTDCPSAAMQAFNRMVDRKMARSPLEGLIIYPEGEVCLGCGCSCPF